MSLPAAPSPSQQWRMCTSTACALLERTQSSSRNHDSLECLGLAKGVTMLPYCRLHVAPNSKELRQPGLERHTRSNAQCKQSLWRQEIKNSCNAKRTKRTRLSTTNEAASQAPKCGTLSDCCRWEAESKRKGRESREGEISKWEDWMEGGVSSEWANAPHNSKLARLASQTKR